jgi:DNA-binding MarR family transcriptional regulator
MHHPHGSACTLPDPEGVDPLSFRVFSAYMRSLHLHRQLMGKLLSGQDSHPGQAFCLRMLAANDGVTQRDLAEAMQLSRPAVTTMLQRMQKAGLIVRRPDETDQRLMRVYLTDEGRALADQMRKTFATYISTAFDSMKPEDREELERLLGIVAENTAAALAGDTQTKEAPLR